MMHAPPFKPLRLLLIGLLLLSISAKIFYFYAHHQEQLPIQAVHPDTATIFVSVASYRDIECQNTLRELFSKAQHPERIYVGLTEQNKTPEESCFSADLGPWQGQIQGKYFDYTAARGPTLARYWCASLYQGQTYFLQIDSHTRFSQDWDSQLIRMLQKLQETHPKAVLTHYPASFEDPGDKDTVAVICKAHFNSQGIPTFEAQLLPAGRFYPSPSIAGGFLFTEGRVLKAVPLDPDLPYLFEGEEVLYAARLYTHGYDLFSPDHNVLYHHYIREGAPKFWTDNTDYGGEQAQTHKKLKVLLGATPGKAAQGGTYGMGTQRTLESYASYASLDFKVQQTHTADKFCNY